MLLGRVALHALCFAAAFAVAPLSAGGVEPGDPTTRPLTFRVRGATPAMDELIQQGIRRSRTFRHLVAALNDSDVIVYLEMKHGLPPGLDGRLTFMTAAGGVRYLHAQVTNGLGLVELIAVAGHELQHAVEIADHPEVRDAGSLALLYERIGVQGTVKNRYDTAAAQDAGRRVRQELN